MLPKFIHFVIFLLAVGSFFFFVFPVDLHFFSILLLVLHCPLQQTCFLFICHVPPFFTCNLCHLLNILVFSQKSSTALI
nr:hypothetical protein Iba_chr06fCG7200 [Ipomoea batatas]